MLCGQEVTYKEPQLKATLFFVTSASHGKSHLLASYSGHDISTALQRGGHVGAFSSHSPLLTFQVMLYMQCQGYTTQTTPVWWHKEKQKSHAMPFLGGAFYKLRYLQVL